MEFERGGRVKKLRLRKQLKINKQTLILNESRKLHKSSHNCKAILLKPIVFTNFTH